MIHFFSFLLFSIFPFFLFSQTVEITIGGDLMLDRGVRKSVEKQGNAAFLLDDVDSLFQSSHFTLVNLETTVIDSGKKVTKLFNFKMNPEWLSDLKKSGITHVDVANNHSFDFGLKGFEQTISNIKKHKLIPFGTRNDYRKPINIQILDTLNQKIAIIAASTFGLGIKVQKKDTLIPAVSNIYNLNKEISAFKKQFPDVFLMVMLHWGIEYEETPSKSQVKLANSMIDSGADMIIGHHPHILQKIDYYKGKPIFYSIGNLIFDQRDAKTKESMLVKLFFENNELIKFNLFPIRIKKFKPTFIPVNDAAFLKPIYKELEKSAVNKKSFIEIPLK